MTLTPGEVRTAQSAGALKSWARTEDRSARTAPARRALLDRFERQVDPDGELSPQERARRAETARRAHMKELALRSAISRRLAKEHGHTAEAHEGTSPP